jgi:hypothetical protein
MVLQRDLQRSLNAAVQARASQHQYMAQLSHCRAVSMHHQQQYWWQQWDPLINMAIAHVAALCSKTAQMSQAAWSEPAYRQWQGQH